MTERGARRQEVESVLEAYIAAFETGTREELQSFCRLPIAYVSDDEVQLRERYPFDPVKLREGTGIRRSNVRLNVLHVDDRKAHVLIEGTREREDGSIVENIEAVYILHRLDGAWKISLISGIRTLPPGG